ncbi:MAG: aspartate--tRNA ligase [Clostridiales bacterium]|nr:aspartate--tRNA ligase [Clostridiales bacterium]
MTKTISVPGSGTKATEQPPVKTSLRYRDLTCGGLRPEHIGQTVKIAGWVMTIRDHGGIVFIDLRDQYGVTQISCTDEQIAALGKEYSVSVTGKVLARDPETYNPNIETGEVEIRAEEIEILGPCRAGLPFEIDQSRDTREEVRLKYRYLDLRNPKLKDNLILRAEVIKHLRREMEDMGFLEIQTPILANSSPEGARDYLVPSRKHKGKFYALPQAPQQFKQLLMVAGFDRYFQIAPCFRDEDARLDRSPGEFYQLDFEMAYATQEDVFAVAERALTSTFGRFSGKKVSQPPYRRLTYAEAMLKYGTDKPDLRNPLEIIDVSAFFENVEFELFKGRTVRAINVPAATGQSRTWFKEMEKYAFSIGMKGLGYISVQEDGSYKGPIDKFLTNGKKKELKELAALKPGDVLYFICDEPGKVAGLAGQIRSEAARRLGLVDESRFDFCFITDYPMYEYNEEAGKIDFTHNPFSMPQGEMDALLTKDPLDVLAWQYDIVCNGVELSSGAVRNHRPDIMVRAFEIAGYTEKDVEQKFGALYSAFSYGAPPHAGMAPGVDRIVMLLAGEENIRETIAFPLNSNAQNLMLDAPGEVTEQQLREVHIKIR